MSLTTYTRKRNFRSTPEPKKSAKAATPNLSFVVQRHAASHLHYDFRLELDGVLKSWAVPKGPSLNPKDKRLAVMVEDHPVAYGKFHGTIPKGNYGAGTVDIWDAGTYTPEKTDSKDASAELRKELKSGSLKFILNGKKLKGSFALVQLKDGKQKNWLLIKHRDAYAADEYDIESEHPVKRSSNKQAAKVSGKQPPSKRVRSGQRKLTHFIKPMLATLTDKPFSGPDWIFEIKWDGYRAISEITKNSVKLYSRNGLSFLELYPEVADALQKIRQDTVLDGEIVVLDKNSKPSFQKLQHFPDNRNLPIQYMIFDCLSVDGKDLTDLPLVERKKIVKKIIPESKILKFSDHVETDGDQFYKEIVKLGGLEGMIAKRADSSYEQGRRTTNWLKVKNHNTQEAIIAGFTEPRASRKYFGALILGIREKGKLRYIGHTGTGFTEKLLKELYQTLKPLVRDTSPFDTKVSVNSPVTWVEPTLVCNVKYTELTEEGIMRHPVFMGLRIDKPAKEVDHLDTPMNNKKTTAKKTTSAGTEKIKVDGHQLVLTNQQKVFWPKEGYTKGDVIAYYDSVAPHILPYLKNRPQSLKRNPNGIGDKGFFHKDAGTAAPSWVKHTAVYAESSGKNVEYILCNDKATLLYLNNLGCIEINPWNSRITKPDHPDYLIMDIDPSDKNSFNEVIDTALVIKDVLDKAGANCYCKTSGATGMHIYIPLHAAYTYEQARPFAKLVATLAQEQLPSTTTLERSLTKRKGRIYIDYLQNSKGQTLSSVYSLRPVEGASVSAPLAWKEVKHGLHPSDFNIQNMSARIKKSGAIFTGVLTDKNNLQKCIKALEG